MVLYDTGMLIPFAVMLDHGKRFDVFEYEFANFIFRFCLFFD